MTYALGGMRYIPQGEALTAANIRNEVAMDKVRFQPSFDTKTLIN